MRHVNRFRLTANLETELYKLGPFLHATWNPATNEYNFYDGHKLLFTNKSPAKALAKLKARGVRQT